jgi:ribonuclease VapC
VALAEAETLLISSCCLLEASIATTSRLGSPGQAELDHLLDVFAVEVVSFTPDQAALAAEAWRRFGKGRHRAALNILDCGSCALAESRGLPLLAVGDDFVRAGGRDGRLWVRLRVTHDRDLGCVSA